MADYRNVPIKFALGGINLTVAPENVPDGQGTRMLNVRPTKELLIEARQGTGSFSYPQPEIAGYEAPYPSFWNLGTLRDVRFIGKVLDSDGNSVKGYLTIHEAPTSGDDVGLYYFINGMPLIRKYCDTTVDPLDNDAFEYASKLSIGTDRSIIRASAVNGVAIVIIEGKYFVKLNQVDYASPDTTNTNLGYTGTVNLGAIPGIYVYDLGATKPTLTSVTDSGSASSNLTASTLYSYRIAWYDSLSGFESPASDAVTYTTDGTPNQPRLTWSKPDPSDVGNSGMNKVRIYRQGDTITGGERLVDTVTLEFQTCALGGGTTTYDDDIIDTTVILNALIDADLAEPFTSVDAAGAATTANKLERAFGTFNGRTVFWVGDSVRKNIIYWNNGGDLSLSDPINDSASIADSAEELLNGFIFGSAPYVWSKKNLYALLWNGPSAVPQFTPQAVPLGIGSAGKYSFAVGTNIVAVCAADGIYLTNCQPQEPVSITDRDLKPIFRGISVNSIEGVDFLSPDDIRLSMTAKELHFFYKGIDSGSTFHLVYDLENSRWFQWTTTTYVSAYVNEAVAWHQILFGHTSDQTTFVFDDVFTSSNETFTARIRGGSYDSGIPLTHKEFGALMLDFDPQGADITIQPYYDSEEVTGTELTTDTLGDTNGRRIKTWDLGDVYYKSLSLDISWTESPTIHPQIYQGNLHFRDDEEATVHWEHPETALGLDGWFHVRDSFWCVRSAADITLKVTVDGQAETYTLASTSGERRKVYQEFKPRRGKVIKFELDSTSPFRFYGEDSILYAKSWTTGSSYQKVSPFQAAGYAQYRRTEGGT